MNKRILFLCQHGGAKSVIASTLFNRLARENALPFVSDAMSAEDPYAEVPAPVTDYLLSEGADVSTFKPRRVETADIDDAEKVVSIDCALTSLTIPEENLERWDDVPPASEDLDGSAAAIRRHVETLVKDLRGRG